jgi:Protein-L-isoaspartate(D-aspartate) O-methyltransferase (PCMT)
MGAPRGGIAQGKGPKAKVRDCHDQGRQILLRGLAKHCVVFRVRAESTPGPVDEVKSMLDLARARDRMVDIQIARRGIRDPYVLEALRRIPREAFVEPGFEEFAYEDGPLPIDEGQTISQPYIVALMIEAAEVKPGNSVLEVGAGSGYAAAVMGQIADRVYAIERQSRAAPSVPGAPPARRPRPGSHQKAQPRANLVCHR